MEQSSRKTILVVDDSATAVMYLSLLLRRMGFRVVPARSAVEALRLVNEQHPDLILLDLNMPLMNGLSFLNSLKSSRETHAPPVIVVTVEGDPSVRERCFQAGCVGYLHKPLQLAELHDQIETCLGSRTPARKHLRASFEKPVAVAALGQVRQYPALALSERSIYLKMPEPLPEGTPTAVTLFLDDGQPLVLEGKVLRGRDDGKAGNGAGVAILFHDLSSGQSLQLRRVVKQELAAELFYEPGHPLIDLDKP